MAAKTNNPNPLIQASDPADARLLAGVVDRVVSAVKATKLAASVEKLAKASVLALVRPVWLAVNRGKKAAEVISIFDLSGRQHVLQLDVQDRYVVPADARKRLGRLARKVLQKQHTITMDLTGLSAAAAGVLTSRLAVMASSYDAELAEVRRDVVAPGFHKRRHTLLTAEENDQVDLVVQPVYQLTTSGTEPEGL